MPILEIGGGGVFGRAGDPTGYFTGRVGILRLTDRYRMWGFAGMVDRVGSNQWQLGGYGTFKSEVLAGAPMLLELGAQRRLGHAAGTFVRGQVGIQAFLLPLFLEGQRALKGDEWIAVAGVRIDLALLGLVAFFITTHGRQRPSSR
ncbi:MAG TPA: hypothetical protein VGF45_04630 [Polyangia bacterium]